MRNESEIQSLELVSAAYHEAGHLVVIGRYGGVGSARLWKPPSRDAGEKSWVGRVMLLSLPERTRRPYHQKHMVHIGLAGLVAEAMARGTDLDGVACEVEDAICLGNVSDSDLDLIGLDYSIGDIEETHDILSSQWEEVKFEAENLIRTAEINHT